MSSDWEDMRIVQQGQEAAAALGSDILSGAFEKVRAELHARWESSPDDNPEYRERCYRELHALRAIESQLYRFVEGGALKAQKGEERPPLI